MRRIYWHLHGTTRRLIVADGAHVQDAFTRLSPRDRRDITQFCTHVIWKHLRA